MTAEPQAVRAMTSPAAPAAFDDLIRAEAGCAGAVSRNQPVELEARNMPTAAATNAMSMRMAWMAGRTLCTNRRAMKGPTIDAVPIASPRMTRSIVSEPS